MVLEFIESILSPIIGLSGSSLLISLLLIAILVVLIIRG